MVSAVNGKVDVCKYLLKAGADVNLGDNYINSSKTGATTGLHAVEGILFINTYIFHFMKNTYSILCVVLLMRDEEFCNRLNNRATFLGCTALHYAVLADEPEIVQMLLEAGADPCIENDSGHRPIQFATDGEIKQMLEEYTAKVINKLIFINII